MAEPESDTPAIAETVEQAAGEHLGVESWDRPAIFRESADAATDNDLPYWAVLVLSGAIATLGLAIDSSAVVIGAMLVAPLLGPVIGLALSLAVGDGRLAVQTGAVVVGSTLAVILASAALTALLPFQTITLEISARTRPTTLDLAIAVFSGLVGAVVTVARGSRLSAAIPGVAISVALIPPLAVAGFGIGIGWNGDLIRGSILLYSANLAGIVLSGMVVFLLVGMHREGVLQAARRWHREGEPRGLARWADRAPLVRSLDVFQSVWARIGLVVAFAFALGIPLSESLAQIAREARIESAVSDVAEELFDQPGRASILDREVVYGPDRAQAYLRVATTGWFGPEAREVFERTVSARAGEPVRLSLEQLPARGEDIEQLAALLPGRQEIERRTPPPPPGPTDLAGLLAAAGARLRQALGVLSLPDDAEVIGLELATTEVGRARLDVAYAAPERFGPQAEQMLQRQLSRALELPDLQVGLVHVSTAARPLAGTDSLRAREVLDLMRRYETLTAEILAPAGEPGRRAQEVAEWLTARGIAPERLRGATATEPALRLLVRSAGEPEDSVAARSR